MVRRDIVEKDPAGTAAEELRKVIDKYKGSGEGAKGEPGDENVPRGNGTVLIPQPQDEIDKRLRRDWLKAQIQAARSRVQEHSHSGTFFVIAALVIYFIDGWIGYAGFIEFNWVKFPQTIWGIVGSAPFIVLF